MSLIHNIKPILPHSFLHPHRQENISRNKIGFHRNHGSELIAIKRGFQTLRHELLVLGSLRGLK